jgi:hypothetical protein
MPGLVPGIHIFSGFEGKMWIAGTGPAMTKVAIFATSRYDK